MKKQEQNNGFECLGVHTVSGFKCVYIEEDAHSPTVGTVDTFNM